MPANLDGAGMGTDNNENNIPTISPVRRALPTGSIKRLTQAILLAVSVLLPQEVRQNGYTYVNYDSVIKWSKTMQQTISGPEIKGGVNATAEAQVRDYIVDYMDNETDVEIDWSRVTINVTGKMTRCYGKAYHKLPDSVQRLAISSHIMDDDYEWRKTARHEAFHVYQYQKDGSADHGSEFRRFGRQHDVDVHAPTIASKWNYILTCEECGSVCGRYVKMGKTVKRYRDFNSSCCKAGLKLIEP